jgi:glucose-6-phosphate 1-dehydrogenase
MRQTEENMHPTTVVIFGASGDLTQRKLIPALYNLYRKERLPEDMRIVGYARRPYSHADFRQRLREGVETYSGKTFDGALWEEFATRLWYVHGDLSTPDDYTHLESVLRDMEGGTADRLYYLATAPDFYVPVTEHLAAAGMARENGGERRIIIEKPFGRDLKTAQELNQRVHEAFQEHQIYRIDHYLGKETAQNIMFFRFGNTVFETVWNRRYIDHVQITVAEDVDVGHRAGYYDKSGVLRDMFQNHLLQLLALVAMEPPASFKANAVRNEKVKVLESIRPIEGNGLAEHTVRAQYRGYPELEGVAPNTQTATYAALRLFIDNWRWQGVPFYLRSGKALARKSSEVVIQFRCPPHMMFPMPADQHIAPDVLSLCIQPDEGIHFRFEAKVPDTVAEMRSANMTFHYDDICEFGGIPEAYERLLLDALLGDATLFIRSDAIERAWELIDPVIHGWQGKHAPPMATYEPGTWGPDEADALMRQDGREWLWGCRHE